MLLSIILRLVEMLGHLWASLDVGNHIMEWKDCNSDIDGMLIC